MMLMISVGLAVYRAEEVASKSWSVHSAIVPTWTAVQACCLIAPVLIAVTMKMVASTCFNKCNCLLWLAQISVLS